jgi:sigma-B regulation protein RsbU (phosphoserine phosphatase)
MTELLPVFAAFHDATGCEAALWVASGPDGALKATASAPRTVAPPPIGDLPAGGRHIVQTARGPMLVESLPGPRRAWLAIGPCVVDDPQHDRFLRFLGPVVAQYLKSTLEVEHAANELAERYEEINLLYTTSEILGRTVTLEEAATTILTEISETVGARRGSIVVHDRVTDTLQVVAALGARAEELPPIAVDDTTSVSARVFRTLHPAMVDGEDGISEAEAPYRRGSMLSVPILWTGPEQPEPLGVVNLSDRRSGQPFSAGDQKLVQAIAAQIGTAIQNARLVRASLAQQRLLQEMQLAHDLQMKLLPNVKVVEADARVAARVVPAESVGGDFYHLFRLGPGRTGVMVGDVSSHGYRAALIMALAMSATAIHAQGSDDPAATLDAVQSSLRDELESTEMFITAFYGVIDRARGELRWANTGHPHAFLISADGRIDRMPGMDPPIGMLSGPPSGASRPWKSGEDMLLLFTDGISDARNRLGARIGEQPVLDMVIAQRHESPEKIVECVFDLLTNYMGDAPKRDDLTLVVFKN